MKLFKRGLVEALLILVAVLLMVIGVFGGFIFGVTYFFGFFEERFGATGTMAVFMSIALVFAIFVQQLISTKSTSSAMKRFAEMQMANAQVERYRTQTELQELKNLGHHHKAAGQIASKESEVYVDTLRELLRAAAERPKEEEKEEPEWKFLEDTESTGPNYF